jgi:hypothetical protein
MELYQSVFCVHFFVVYFLLRQAATTVSVHAALPHKNLSLRLCRQTKTVKNASLYNSVQLQSK